MNNIDSFNEAAERLKEGQVGIFPTDTAYGIGCRMDNVTAVKRIYEIRNRPSEKALLILVSSIEMAREYVSITEEAMNIVGKYWPGGVTFILPCIVEKVPGIVRSNGSTLAVRLPAHEDLRKMIETIGVPIVAPSANFSGEITPTTISEVDQALQEHVDFSLSGMCTMKGISTIVDLTGVRPVVVRQGVVTIHE